MTLQEIENTVASLSPSELAQFRTWFVEFDAEIWDDQIQQDIQAGKLDSMANEALRAHQQGKTQEL